MDLQHLTEAAIEELFCEINNIRIKLLQNVSIDFVYVVLNL